MSRPYLARISPISRPYPAHIAPEQVRGLVPSSELRASLGAVWEADPHSCYREGQVVRCRVVRSEPEKKKLLLTFVEDSGAEAA